MEFRWGKWNHCKWYIDASTRWRGRRTDVKIGPLQMSRGSAVIVPANGWAIALTYQWHHWGLCVLVRLERDEECLPTLAVQPINHGWQVHSIVMAATAVQPQGSNAAADCMAALTLEYVTLGKKKPKALSIPMLFPTREQKRWFDGLIWNCSQWRPVISAGITAADRRETSWLAAQWCVTEEYNCDKMNGSNN